MEMAHCRSHEESIGLVICKTAVHRHAQVIVMAKHEQGRLRELFLGSNTDFVIRHAKCGVVVTNMD
jgi:nucleotide-binding universal stress UspA family protein